jgi:peptide-methionine (S)-S-oxide reductase
VTPSNSRLQGPVLSALRGSLRGIVAALLLLAAGWTGTSATSRAAAAGGAEAGAGAAAAVETASAIFAGGCFWCMEPPFDDLPGVLETTSGYIGGQVRNPSYEQVVTGRTGHTEAVRVVYDPSQVDYATLLYVFWRNIDPLTANRQFCDGGNQYRSGIFYLDAAQREQAEASLEALRASGRFTAPIVTELTQAGPFYPAEDYHQDYYEKNPLRYKYYRYGCGRDQRLRELWGDEAGGSPPPPAGRRRSPA